MSDAAPWIEHPNATLVRGLFQAFADADIARLVELVPEACTWHFPGRAGGLAGTHVGRDAVFGFLLRVGELTDGTFHLDLHDVIANDTWAVALFTGSARRQDKTLDNPTSLRIRFANGAISEIHEFVWDLFAVDDFWS
jgi:ketosteroid isomerase-like protein